MSKIFTSKPVRIAFWLQFLIILAISLHFFTPDFRRMQLSKLDGRVVVSYDSVEIVEGHPVIKHRPALNKSVHMRHMKILPVGITDTMIYMDQINYSSRVYCLDTNGVAQVLGNFNNFKMKKTDAGQFTAALMYAIQNGVWLDVFILGVDDPIRRIAPNIMVIFNSNGGHVIGKLDPQINAEKRKTK